MAKINGYLLTKEEEKACEDLIKKMREKKVDDKILELFNTVIIFANKMNFPWRFKKFTTESEEEIFGLYVYSYGCDPDCSNPIMYWEWYLEDWSEFDGNFPYSYY